MLTPAEWRVVECVRHGQTNPEIAARLQVSLDAVKFHIANVLSKLGFSNRREIQLWDGVSRASAMARGGRTTSMAEGFGVIGQVSRTVRDIEVSSRWYRDVLQLPQLFSFGNIAFFDCGGLRLYLSEAESDNAQSILYFSVGNIHAAWRELEGRGVEFINAPHMVHRHEDGTEEWMAFFKDPDDRPLALMSQVRHAERDDEEPK